jgi:hypothetical protein
MPDRVSINPALATHTTTQDETHPQPALTLPPTSHSQGGFAKCYLLTEVDSNRQWAGKIVEKKTLIKYRAKEKVSNETRPPTPHLARTSIFDFRKTPPKIEFREVGRMREWRVTHKRCSLT